MRKIRSDYFGKGDLEAFFGLFGDVFSKIVAIVGVLLVTDGFPAEIVMGKILPGIAMGSLIGNIFFFWEAYSLNKRENRKDATALPFGVSSTQVFAWLYLILLPIYKQTGDAELAWQVSIAACFFGGLIEVAGGFVSRFMERYLPNSALLGNMAAGALVWLSFNGFITVFDEPLIGVIPLFLILITTRLKNPLIKKIPNTFLVIFIGAIVAWGTGFCNVGVLQDSLTVFQWYSPGVYLTDIWSGFGKIGPYLSTIIPLQIANSIDTMEAIQGAKVAGDNYPLKRNMIMDGVTTIISSVFGSPFPTSIYYGHLSWKKIGTRSGYLLLMIPLYITCFFGLPAVLLQIVPYEVIVVLLVFVGLTVASEIVDNLEKEYSSLIFISLFPIVVQYIEEFVDKILGVAGTSVQEIGMEKFAEGGVMLNGIQILAYGAFASSLLYAAWLAYIYMKKYNHAGMTAVLLAFLSLIGFIHNEQIQWFPKQGCILSMGYIVIAVACFFVGKREKKRLK